MSIVFCCLCHFRSYQAKAVKGCDNKWLSHSWWLPSEEQTPFLTALVNGVNVSSIIRPFTRLYVSFPRRHGMATSNSHWKTHMHCDGMNALNAVKIHFLESFLTNKKREGVSLHLYPELYWRKGLLEIEYRESLLHS